MVKKILVPLDGSKTAENALPLARFLARRLELLVQLLSVIDLTELARSVSAAEGLYLDGLVAYETRSSEEYLAQIAKTFSDVGVQWLVARGKAADIIIENAAADEATLIAMATHGRSGLNRFLLGSVAEKILRGASNPLLLVRAAEGAQTEGEAPFTSIVVPLDGSEIAESALPAVVAMARRLDSEIVLFRAYNVSHSIYGGDDSRHPAIVADLIGGIKGEALDYLEKKTTELRERGAKKVSYTLKEGLSADQIIALARKTPDNLIVMCSHGRSGVKRWVLGSVTETVVRHSGDPVLVLRAS
jgi:nucleotide-binding universal stress UspA family protein